MIAPRLAPAPVKELGGAEQNSAYHPQPTAIAHVSLHSPTCVGARGGRVRVEQKVPGTFYMLDGY